VPDRPLRSRADIDALGCSRHYQRMIATAWQLGGGKHWPARSRLCKWATPPVPPHVAVWRSVRAGDDTKTRKSRRTLALPRRCIDVLRDLRQRQDRERAAAGSRWQDNGLVFTTRYGTPLRPENVRRDFRKAIKNAAGVDAGEWTPRELRHSFVSLLSDSGIPVEEISRLVGHKNTTVTELVYRKQIRPVLQHGADAMNRIFKADEGA
jgi:integrase